MSATATVPWATMGLRTVEAHKAHRSIAQAARVAPAAADSDAFAQAVAAHHQALARFAYALCGDPSQAEDVVAEAYARVWRRWQRGRVENLYGYLRRTVANEIYGRHRRRLLERREAEKAPERGPDGRFEDRVDDRDALWAALAQLSPRYRVVVVLRVVEDLSEEETATMLGVPAGTVKSRLSRGLGLLRDAIEAAEGGDERAGGDDG